MTISELWQASGLTRAAAIHASEQLDAAAIENWQGCDDNAKTNMAYMVGMMLDAAETGRIAVLDGNSLKIVTNFATMGFQKFLLMVDAREQEQ